jgi:uncharacterized membrane protein
MLLPVIVNRVAASLSSVSALTSSFCPTGAWCVTDFSGLTVTVAALFTAI